MGLCLAEIWASLGCECPASAWVSARAPCTAPGSGARSGAPVRSVGEKKRTVSCWHGVSCTPSILIVAKNFCFVLNMHAGSAQRRGQRPHRASCWPQIWLGTCAGRAARWASSPCEPLTKHGEMYLRLCDCRWRQWVSVTETLPLACEDKIRGGFLPGWQQCCDVAQKFSRGFLFFSPDITESERYVLRVLCHMRWCKAWPPHMGAVPG